MCRMQSSECRIKSTAVETGNVANFIINNS